MYGPPFAPAKIPHGFDVSVVPSCASVSKSYHFTTPDELLRRSKSRAIAEEKIVIDSGGATVSPPDAAFAQNATALGPNPSATNPWPTIASRTRASEV